MTEYEYDPTDHDGADRDDPPISDPVLDDHAGGDPGGEGAPLTDLYGGPTAEPGPELQFADEPTIASDSYAPWADDDAFEQWMREPTPADDADDARSDEDLRGRFSVPSEDQLLSSDRLVDWAARIANDR